MSLRYPRLCAAALLIICVVWPCHLEVEAKGKKGKASASRSKGRSSKRYSAKKSRKTRHQVSTRVSADDLALNDPVVDDKVEVLEYGSSSSAELARHLNPPAPRSPSQDNFQTVSTIAPRRKNVRIESSRVLQIQQALASRGFYGGELTGVYDEATIDAMRRFQASQKIQVTGYPTAHALKRLGLGNW